MRKNFHIRYCSLVVLIAFAINAIMPFFAVYNPADYAKTQHLSSLFGERLLICTGDGFKWIKLADLQSGKEKPKPHTDDKCPLCYAARHGLKMLTVATNAIPMRYAIYAPVSVRYDYFSVSFPPASPLNVRAPPSFIS